MENGEKQENIQPLEKPGHKITNDERMKWSDDYGKKVSDLIDHPGHEEIRALARAGKYEEAAVLLKKALEEFEGEK